MKPKLHATKHQENLIGSGVATCGARGDIAFTCGGPKGVNCLDCRARIRARIERSKTIKPRTKALFFDQWMAKVIAGSVTP